MSEAKTTTREIRSLSERDAQPKLSDDGKTIVGYASVFNSLSQDLGGFYEIIKPGAFDRCLAGSPDVRGLVDHDSGKVLGRTKSGTLKLSVDQRGLKYEISPPDTCCARDLMISMKRGDIDGSSFAFSVAANGDKWSTAGEKVIREVNDVDLYDVSVVTYPAYLAAESSLRSLSDFKKQSQTPAAPVADPTADAAAIAVKNAHLRRRMDLAAKDI